jgi:hypothetical protein
MHARHDVARNKREGGGGGRESAHARERKCVVGECVGSERVSARKMQAYAGNNFGVCTGSDGEGWQYFELRFGGVIVRCVRSKDITRQHILSSCVQIDR